MGPCIARAGGVSLTGAFSKFRANEDDSVCILSSDSYSIPKAAVQGAGREPPGH